MTTSPLPMCGCGCGNQATGRRGRIEDFAELRSWGVSLRDAADRLGVSSRTAERYSAELKRGQPKPERPSVCKQGCDRPVVACGYCNACYQRWIACGRPESGPPPPMTTSERGSIAGHARWDRWRQERATAA